MFVFDCDDDDDSSSAAAEADWAVVRRSVWMMTTLQQHEMNDFVIFMVVN